MDIKDFMIIDTPGMIDSPAMLNSSIASNMERGYDFEKVVKWYAARADLVLLFFDPEKPGTTGETLSTLTNALSGMDHKLHIILNKADQFRKIHDFARAYGSVCWNLSKVCEPICANVIPLSERLVYRLFPERIYPESIPCACHLLIEARGLRTMTALTERIWAVELVILRILAKRSLTRS